MGSFRDIWDCRYDIIHYDKEGNVLWEMLDKHNVLTDEGERAIGEVFFRGDTSYFPVTDFFVGLYNGVISESSTLTNIPNEPTVAGYARLQLERSPVGFPTVEQHNGDWRWVSKDLTIEATGGEIGPISGAFLCTSSDNNGSLIGAVAIGVSRTIQQGDYLVIRIRPKLK